jgi:FkbM family methyltransferase
MLDRAQVSRLEVSLHQPHLRLRQCRHGWYLFNVNDLYCGTMLDKYGEFSEGENDLFRLFLRPGMTVAEFGANIGIHTVSIAQMVGPQGRVLAFEPQRSVFQIMCANLALNGLEQVEPHWAAAGGTSGHLHVPRLDSQVPSNFGGLSLAANNQEGDHVRLVTLDSFELHACHLLKIDVEGMESEVLVGAEQTIRRFRPIIYTENDRADKSPALIGKLQELGYRCYWHLPPYVRIPNYRLMTENLFPGLISINMLCIPRSLDITVQGLREVESPMDRWNAP